MADISSSDVSYSVKKLGCSPDSRSRNIVTISFGDGVLTYPAGGVPLDGKKMGLPTVIDSLVFVDDANANALRYKYDKSNNKIRIYEDDGTSGVPAELSGGVDTPAAATLVVEVSGH